MGLSNADGVMIFNKTKENKNMKYQCVCGYLYDESTGDPRIGIQEGTKWEDIPDDFSCPLCGLGKDAFSIK